MKGLILMNIDILFNDIYNRTYNKVFSYILAKTQNITDVDDIIQDTYTDFYFILEKKYQKIDNKEAYLMKITKNKIAKYYSFKNKRKVESGSDEIILNIPDDFDLASDAFINFTIDEIWKETKELNIDTQKILILYFREDYKISDIGEMLKLNESTVKSKLYRGIADLKERLD